MRILAIETSCDETAFAVVSITQNNPVRNKISNGASTDKTLLRPDTSGLRKGTTQTSAGSLPIVMVEENLVASQVKLHAPFGGVVPTLAKREHLKNLPILWKKIQKNPAVCDKKIDLFAVTVGPGLEPALWTGLQFAQKIHTDYFNDPVKSSTSNGASKIPLIGVNHLHGHLYSFLLTENKKLKTKNVFPMISLIVSGGHTILGVLRSLTEYEKLGKTVDDAVGESFDKVARLLDLPYPGGPLIEQLAKEGNANAIKLPHPMQNQKNYNFSYAGLKTAVLYYLRTQGIVSQNFSPSAVAKKARISKQLQRDLSASFQEAAFAPLIAKTKRAAMEYGARTICVGGGVAANKRLPELLKSALGDEINIIVPPLAYCQDNAAMIAVAGYVRYKNGNHTYPLVADGTLSL